MPVDNMMKMIENQGYLHKCLSKNLCENDKKITYNALRERLYSIKAESEPGLDFSGAGYEISLIIEKVCGFSRAKILSLGDFDYNGELPADKLRELEEMLDRRINMREPLQYILGEWGFMGHMFSVGSGCLIPRADTEILCEYAIANIPAGGTFADLCSGSGCIAVSVLMARPDIKQAAAAEISPDALRYLKANAENHGVADRLEIIEADITAEILPGRKFDMILSNPPYIPTRDIQNLAPELSFEPSLALDGGSDGLDIIRKIIELYPKKVKPNGKIVIEFGYDQSAAVSGILSAHGFAHKILTDYGANSRAAAIDI